MSFLQYLESHAQNSRIMADFRRCLRTRDENKVLRHLAVLNVDISCRDKIIPFLYAGYVFASGDGKGTKSVPEALKSLAYKKDPEANISDLENVSATEKRLLKVMNKPLSKIEADLKTILTTTKKEGVSHKTLFEDLLLWEVDYKGAQGKKWLQAYHGHKTNTDTQPQP